MQGLPTTCVRLFVRVCELLFQKGVELGCVYMQGMSMKEH